MADLLPPLNYAGQLADAAAAYGQANHLNQMAEQQRLQNNIKKMVMPLIAKGISGESEGNQDAPAQYPVNFQQTRDPSGQGDGQTGQQGTVTQPAAQPGTQIQPQPGIGGVGADGIPDMLRRPSPSDSGDGSIDAAAGGGSATAAAVPTAPKTLNQKIADHADSVAAQTLMPSPTDMDAPHRTLYMGLMLAGERDGAEGVKAAWDAKVGRENQQKVVMANRALSLGNDIKDVPDDQVLGILQRQAPDIAAKVPKGMDPALLKQSLLNSAGAAFRYTGRPLTLRDDGYVVDGTTGQRVPTLDYRVGLSKDQEVNLHKNITSPSFEITINGANRKIDYVGWVNKQRTNAGLPPLSEDQVESDLLGESAKTGVPVFQVLARKIAAAGGKVLTTVPTVTAAATSGGPVSYNSGTGTINASAFSPEPSMHATGWNVGNTDDQRTNAQLYPDILQKTTQQKGAAVQEFQNAITTNKKILRTMDTGRFGPGSGNEAYYKNLAVEILGRHMGETIGQFRDGDPASWNIVNKLLTQASVQQVTHSADSTRVSAELFKFGDNISANVTQNPVAIRDLVRYDTALKQYGLQRDGADYKSIVLDGHHNANTYDNEYSTQNNENDAVNRYLAAMDSHGNIDNKALVPGGYANPLHVESAEEAGKLNVGAYYIGHDGKLRQKQK